MFVDTRIEGYETIVAGIAPTAEVVLIDASGDGVAQMAQALAERSDIEAIHIVGHGQAGLLLLGSAALHAGNLDAYTGELGAIGRALAPGGDIQLWGCEIGAGSEGRTFIHALAGATGADVAASDDLTGASGDWTLEVASGEVAASAALDAATLDAFQGSLASVAGTIDFTSGTVLGPTVTDGMGGSSDIPGAVYQILATSTDGTPTGVAWEYFSDPSGLEGIGTGAAEGDPVVVIRTADSSQFWFKGITTSNHIGAQTRVTFEGFRDGVSTGAVTLNVAPTGIDTYTVTDLPASTFQNVDEVRITNPDYSGSFFAYDNIVLGDPVVPNLSPVIDANGAGGGTANAVTFTENGPAVRILTSDATLTDDDNLTSMTLKLASTPDGAAELMAYSAALNGGASLASLGLSGAYDSATGTYTISGTAASAVYQGVARAMVYANSSEAPATASRTVTISATDADGATGQATATITVAAVNDAPTATNLSQSTGAAQGGPSVALNDIVVTDVDTGDTITATLTLSDPAAGALSTGTFGSATSTFNTGTGVWTVAGSVADVNAALASVALTPSAGNAQDFSITTRIRDAAGTGPADGTIAVTVAAADPPPSVSGAIAVPANGSYAAGQTLSFTVTFDENVTVTGTDSVLGLTIGSVARDATFASSTANSITYVYTVQAGDTDANGISVGGVTLGTTTIRDGAGNDAVLNLSGHLPSTAGVLVDTTAPAVASVIVPPNDTYVAGQNLDFTVTFDENVTVTGADGTVGLTVGAAARSAAFLSSSGNTVTYRYTVQAGDVDADGVTIGGLTLGGGSIRDAAGNNAVLTLNSVGATANVLVDATVPTVSGNITVPVADTYIVGDTLNFTVTFNENVTLNGTPSTLGLNIGGAARSATITGTTANSITYSYTVQNGDNDGDGIAVSGVSLNGGTIRDGSGNNANLALSGHVPSTSGVLIDGGPPSVSGAIAVPANGSYAAGQTLSFTLTFDENVTVTGTDSVLGLTIGSVARDATFASSTANSITYAYTVQAGDTDANGISVGGVTLGTTTIKDGGGNDAILNLSGHVPTTAGILVDTTAPAVASVSVPSNGAYAAGQHLDFTVTFDENVTITGTDSALGLTVGAAARSATFLSSSGNTVTYRYTVQAGDADADGVTIGGLTLAGGAIRDAAGNDAVLTLNSVGATGGVLVDASLPMVTGNIGVPADGVYAAGQTLNFTVTFSENVLVSGTDSALGLTIGGAARSATYASKTANSITYAYTVQAGDNDGDGVAVGAISLGSSTIRDGGGNNADLTLTGRVPATTGVLVDTAAPSFVSASINGATLVMTYSDADLLDAAHAPTAGAFAVMAGGAPIAVTAVAVNGAAHTVTLTLASPVAAGVTVTVAYTDPSGGDDANAVQDAGGNDAASLTATSVTNTTAAPPTTTPPTTTLIDGVSVEKAVGATPDGTPTQTVTIPVVLSTRQDQVGNNQVADIPLVTASSGAALLGIQAPIGLGLTASGPQAPRAAGDSLTDLIRAIQAHSSGGSQDQNQLTGGGTSFVNGLTSGTPLLVQTIVTQGGGGSAESPLVIQGQPQDSVQTALVIDTHSQPGGVPIELQNVDFAAIIGAATVTGGAGSQHVWGDSANQSIFLGADDDVLNGGGGNDTVGSAGGNDQVHGDDGDDVVFGGEGDDFVHGNAGNDTARGDAGEDRVYGGKGDDQVFGGGDNDLLFGDLGHDTLQGNTGQDTLSGGEGADLLHGGQDSDVLFGGGDNDLLFGDLGQDSLQGNTGQDTLDGGAGADILYGGQGDDVLFGGDGADTLFGDLGDDTLTGGLGADLYVTAGGRGEDQVLDFNFAAGDRIGLLAGSAYSAAQVDGNTVISLTGGGQMTLVNVQLSGLGDGWIMTI
ncbi:MAG: DUF4347 domain-containing protein [Phenylobacterium sp.]|nr:DUF4347 domain-containing protein [Phenylobacterium sp.]